MWNLPAIYATKTAQLTDKNEIKYALDLYTFGLSLSKNIFQRRLSYPDNRETWLYEILFQSN